MEVEEHPHRHLHIGALVVVIILVLLLFKFNLEKAVNSPQFNQNVTYIEKEANILFEKIKGLFNFSMPINIDQKSIEQKIQPDKINNYFGVPSDEKLNQLSSPTNL